MLGIGGALQNPFQRQPPSDKHMRNVRRTLSVDPSSNAKGGDAEDDEASSSHKKKKRKREKEEESEKEDPKQKKKKKDVKQKERMLDEVIIDAKEKMQGHEKANGITFAFMGSSGCGKSTVIMKVFIEQIFGKKATQARKDKEYIIQIFTLSAKSDAFNELPKDILVDSKGLDQDNINFCFHMNEEYQKKYNFFLMLDDVLDIRYKDLVQRMFLTMRNTNISSLVSLQYPKLIPASIRTSVYFALFFFFNNDEATEHAIRGWLSAYLPGKSIREKILYYRYWTLQNDGHNMFLMDNLNHRCYQIDTTNHLYRCVEMQMLTAAVSFTGDGGGGDGEKEEDHHRVGSQMGSDPGCEAGLGSTT